MKFRCGSFVLMHFTHTHTHTLPLPPLSVIAACIGSLSPCAKPISTLNLHQSRPYQGAAIAPHACLKLFLPNGTAQADHTLPPQSIAPYNGYFFHNNILFCLINFLMTLTCLVSLSLSHSFECSIENRVGQEHFWTPLERIIHTLFAPLPPPSLLLSARHSSCSSCRCMHKTFAFFFIHLN